MFGAGKKKMTTAEAAEALGVNTRTIQRMVQGGELEGHKDRPDTPNSQLSINPASVAEVKKKRKHG